MFKDNLTEQLIEQYLNEAKYLLVAGHDYNCIWGTEIDWLAD